MAVKSGEQECGRNRPLRPGVGAVAGRADGADGEEVRGVPENFSADPNYRPLLLGGVPEKGEPEDAECHANWSVGIPVTNRQNPLLQPSKSGGSEGLSVTVPDHPTLDYAGVERVSKSEAIPAFIADRGGAYLLEKTVLRLAKRVLKMVGEKPIKATTIYVTYEATIDGDPDPGGPMRPPVSGAAAGVVLGGVLERVAA